METESVAQEKPILKAELPKIPETWPGAWHIYKYSKQAVRRNWGVLLLIGILELIAALVFSLIVKKALGSLLADLLNFALEIALISTLLASLREHKVTFSESLKSINPNLYLNYVLNGIALGVITVLSLVLLVIPFFFVFPRLLLSPYFLIDKNMDPLDAIRASWDASKGHVGKVWGVIGVTFAIALLAVTIVGIPFAIYFDFMYSAAFVVLYEYIIHLNPAASTPSEGPTAAAPTTKPALPQVPTPPRPLVQ